MRDPNQELKIGANKEPLRRSLSRGLATVMSLFFEVSRSEVSAEVEFSAHVQFNGRCRHLRIPRGENRGLPAWIAAQPRYEQLPASAALHFLGG